MKQASTLLLLGLIQASLLGQPVTAMVVRVSGKATFKAPGGTYKTLLPMQPLLANAELSLANGAQLDFIRIASGREVKLAGRGSGILGKDGSLTGHWKKVEELPPPAGVSGLYQSPGPLVRAGLGIRGERLEISSPTGATLLEDRPTFKWKNPPPGRLELTLTEGGTGRALGPYALDAVTREFRLPVRLSSGTPYEWTVTSAGNLGLETRKGRFLVLGETERMALEAATPPAHAERSDWIRYLAILLRAGATDAANQVKEQLKRLYPADPLFEDP